ncbi:hypothetical protein FGO68_gene1649 [Halteria grandinella]|uniref:Cyclin-dependent kinases regulatory subunit n=1 Tax=Halteria grandinella TaxID=5974 RepID=A0A8J8SY36_HALGN|nr:hypothetical protein FGO68_gene1649 [Halteria grandinella]
MQFPDEVEYSEKYSDDQYEYRHVFLTFPMFQRLQKEKEVIQGQRFLTEREWRTLGVQQSAGWEHYMVFKPEPYVLLFRRPLPAQTYKPFK